MCTLGSKKRVCLSAESGTGDDSVILTPTRAEISEPPDVELVITISNENGAARVRGGPHPFYGGAFSTCRSRCALSRAVPRVPGISLLACYQGAASNLPRQLKCCPGHCEP